MPGRQRGIEPAVVGDYTLCPPMRHEGQRPQPDHNNIRPPESASSGIFAAVEPTDNRSEDQRPGANGIGATSGKHRADTEPLKL